MSAQSDASIVDRAVRAASEAARSWAATSVAERVAVLRAAASAATGDFDERAAMLIREQGKVLWESQLDLAGAPYLLFECSRLVERVLAETVDDGPRGRFVTRRRPAGVVGVIVPWNYPIVLAFNPIAPVLAAGNTVVVKPSELAPLTLTRTITAVRAAATNITSVGLELGGNDPALVLDSAVVDDGLAASLRDAAFVCSGRVCFAIKRIYVHRSNYHHLVEALTAAIDDLVVGDGLDPASSIGPLISEESARRVAALIEQARSDGATVAQLGSKFDAGGWADGNFVLPHLVTAIAHHSPLVAAEQFGPVLPVVAFDTEEEALQMASDSEFGLAASVWSADDAHAFAVASRIEAGTAFVNVHRAGASDHTTPFGGMKQSGIGRSNGWASIEAMTELQMLIRRDDQDRLPGRPHS